jgi:hypothetical protein
VPVPFLFGIERGGYYGAEVDRQVFNPSAFPLAMIALTGLGLSIASAQTSSQLQNTRSAAATSGSGQYYFEFRSRQAWDYGHTFVVFGRVGEPPSKKNVAGLSPKGDDPQMWLMGHYVPVPSDTGWTDGDLRTNTSPRVIAFW